MPEGPVKVIEASDEQIIVSVDSLGAWYIGDAPVADDMFDVTLQELIRERNADVVYLKGDSAAVYGRVTRAVAGIVDQEARLALILKEFRR